MFWVFVLATLGAGFIGLKKFSDVVIRRTEAKFPPIGQFVVVEGLRLHYVSRGSGRPVVMIHGNDGVLQDFTRSVFDKVSQEYRAIAFDRPGHGYSERPPDKPLTFATNARLIHGALQQFAIEKPVLVGHSFGSFVALQYALDYPGEVAGVVLLAPDAYTIDPRLEKVFNLPKVRVLGPLFMRTLLVPLGYLAIPTLMERSFFPDQVPPAFEQLTPLWLRPKQFQAFTDEWRGFEQGLQALRQRYTEIRVPIIIVAGDSDVERNESHACQLPNAIPGSKLIMLPNTGQQIHWTHPDAVMDAIRQVWKKS